MSDRASRRGRSDLWMPFYIGDYLADTMRLTTVQHGAYVLLLMEYWRNGPLPDDAAPLAAIARCDRKLWDREVWPALRGFFAAGPDGSLHQKRADLERAKAKRLSAQRADAAHEKWRQKRGARGGAASADANAPASAHAFAPSPDMSGTCGTADTRVPQSHSSLRSECDTETTADASASPDRAEAERTSSGSSGPGWIRRVPLVPGVNC